MKPAEMLASLSRLSKRTEQSEQKILDAAVAREAVVMARLEAVRGDALLHAGDEYQALVLERGHLDRVIAMARKHGAK